MGTVSITYKDYGVNPFAGCLPMFIQMPIFFGFYRMLGTAIELLAAVDDRLAVSVPNAPVTELKVPVIH